MMKALYYDRDGRPVSWQQWRQLGRQPGYSRVGYADAVRHGRQVTVITFWSGIAGDGPDGPLIFCTCGALAGLHADRETGLAPANPAGGHGPGTRPVRR